MILVNGKYMDFPLGCSKLVSSSQQDFYEAINLILDLIIFSEKLIWKGVQFER